MSLPPAPILNRTGGNPPTILFNRSSGGTLSFSKTTRHDSSLLRGAKPIASLDQENCATMEVSQTLPAVDK